MFFSSYLHRYIICAFILFFSCTRETDKHKIHSTKSEKPAENDVVYTEENDSSEAITENASVTDNDQTPLTQKTNRRNFYLWQLPSELHEFKEILPECTQGMTSCAACDYCAYLKLADDWSVFAYEADEMKWYRQINIYKKKGGKCYNIQSFKGYVDSIIIEKGVYKMLIAEGTLEYYNTDVRFLYTFSSDQFIKGKRFSDTTSLKEYEDFLNQIKDENGIYGAN